MIKKQGRRLIRKQISSDLKIDCMEQPQRPIGIIGAGFIGRAVAQLAIAAGPETISGVLSGMLAGRSVQLESAHR